MKQGDTIVKQNQETFRTKMYSKCAKRKFQHYYKDQNVFEEINYD